MEHMDASVQQTYYASMMVEEMCGVILDKAFSADNEGYIQLTIVPHGDCSITIHLRDNARRFNLFEISTDKVSLESETDLDALGVKLIKSKTKDFFYRQYAGFNTLVVRV